jgi:MoaA/NifB/PqqE/SkfB family radical SAM enzyme
MPKFPWLLISGGEPFLRADLEEIIGIFYNNNNMRHLTLPTNGLLPERILRVTNNILSRFKNLTVTIAFSLDALENEHDKLRGVKGCYKKLITSYNAVGELRKNKRLNVKFNTVISNQNYKNLKRLIEKVRSLNPDMHTIDFVRGDVKDRRFKLPPMDEIEKIIKMIKENYNYYSGYSNLGEHSRLMRKISSSLEKGYLDLFKEIIVKKKQVIPCLAYEKNLVLYPYGDASFCEPLKSFGNFRDYSYDFKKLINSAEAEKQKAIIKNKKCFCYHPCYQYLNILFSPIRMSKEVIKNVF